MPSKDELIAMLRPVMDEELRALDDLIWTALIDNTPALADLVAKRRALLAFPDTIKDGSQAEIVAQWPKDATPLPLWISDPAAAAVLDPPGQPCVVDMSAKATKESP